VEGAYGLGFLYLCLIARGGELIITCGMEQTGLPVDFEVAMNDPLDESLDKLTDTAQDLLRDFTRYKTALELIAQSKPIAPDSLDWAKAFDSCVSIAQAALDDE